MTGSFIVRSSAYAHPLALDSISNAIKPRLQKEERLQCTTFKVHGVGFSKRKPYHTPSRVLLGCDMVLFY